MGEFEGGDKTGLLVQAATVTEQIDDVLSFILLLQRHDNAICAFTVFSKYINEGTLCECPR